jgi:uncharacterized protein (TIGR02996 family)
MTKDFEPSHRPAVMGWLHELGFMTNNAPNEFSSSYEVGSDEYQVNVAVNRLLFDNKKKNPGTWLPIENLSANDKRLILMFDYVNGMTYSMKSRHPDRWAFHANMAQNQDDDGPRLVFCDWLLENGHEKWSDYIKIQIPCDRLVVETNNEIVPGQKEKMTTEQKKENWRKIGEMCVRAHAIQPGGFRIDDGICTWRSERADFEKDEVLKDILPDRPMFHRPGYWHRGFQRLSTVAQFNNTTQHNWMREDFRPHPWAWDVTQINWEFEVAEDNNVIAPEMKLKLAAARLIFPFAAVAIGGKDKDGKPKENNYATPYAVDGEILPKFD